ncbi:indolepyruvate ferredoxin oxidoreductase subunit alpha [Oscillibacter sp.]|uniref:indolepyruvate ferredoxin oxidoreductase subunit alpha n=1 Tax=Oscillibacter sp. TaxID=1945593 RepID=UPI0028AAFF22|nr:indolepyruvate ferredoxin oxidoreductase subunit alpha [Oscillibacter sp.]
MKCLLTGNEAIARGAWEAGVHYASAYPGTPSTEILENLVKYKEIYSEWAPNEKVALESAIGAAFAGGRAIASMKHVGLNVAADPLFTSAYTGVNGGLMVISADDPGLHSSQDEQDNRYYARAAKIGMLEPSDSQEAKDFVKVALELSQLFDMPIMMRLTTRVCHSKSVVELGEGRTEVPIVPYEKKDKFNPIPAISKQLHSKVEKNLRKLEEYANTTPLNTVTWGSKKVGIVSAGAAYQYAREVYGDNASYLKLGLTFPLPIKKIREFADQVEHLIVVEELEPIMETEIRAAGIPCTGKDKIPNEGELNPDILRKALLGEVHESIEYDTSVVANRPPVMCAGCPHRGFFLELHKLKNTVFVSDIGCYGLAPKDIAICMGGGFSVAHGAQKVFNMEGSGKRCVGMMGDSTFFHSGMTSMLEAVYNRSNVLLVVLDNRITGMTGHQQNPGSGFTLSQVPTNITNIEDVAKALGAKHTKTINPLKLDEVKSALEWGMSFDEPAVLITRWPCVLKKLSQADQEEFGDYKAVNAVDPNKCIGCKACVRTGCPALEYHPETKKVTIDRNQCVGCDICTQVCPKNAISREVK